MTSELCGDGVGWRCGSLLRCCVACAVGPGVYLCGKRVVPSVGARVLVPFSGQKLMGVVVRVHDGPLAEGVEAKPVQTVMDDGALLDEEQMELARWIAQYYCAPLGEVIRGMLPLAAEVRRQFTYRISEQGRKVLYEGAAKGASRRSRLTAEEQNREYAVLNYLEGGDAAKAGALRSATGAGRGLLEGMVKKKWLVREALAEERDAKRVVKVAVIVEGRGKREEGKEGGSGLETGRREEGAGSREDEAGSLLPLPSSLLPASRLPKLNENQLAVMAELARVGGRLDVRDLRERLRRRGVPEASVGSVVKRGLVGIVEEAEGFWFGMEQRTEADSSASPRNDKQNKKHAHEHPLNEEQMEAVGTIAAAMAKGGFRPLLLYGVTGSGKTAVYFAAMRGRWQAGKSALLLVPEIGLTPAMAGQMHAAFGDEVALLHRGLTPDERAEQWHRIRRGEARVVVGTRSAVFAPVKALGLVIVDEEHDGSYKQEETPRYHGRDVAVMRAKLVGAVCVLGSATPSLESWANAERGRYGLIEMRERVMGRALPEVELVDMRREFSEVLKEEIFSRRLVEETRGALDRGEQVILLLNRRGYSFAVICRSCGVKVECENCAIAMTYHKREEGRATPASKQRSPGTPDGKREESAEDGVAAPGSRLECHYCGFRRGVPKACPGCGSEHLVLPGGGVAAGRGEADGVVSGGADREDGSGYGARAARYGAAAGAAACGGDQPAGGDADDRQGA